MTTTPDQTYRTQPKLGEPMNLTYARLTDADLHGEDLTDADLTGADLTDANLDHE